MVCRDQNDTSCLCYGGVRLTEVSAEKELTVFSSQFHEHFVAWLINETMKP